jgi:son of sevenless-like protein
LWALGDGIYELRADADLYKQFKNFCDKVFVKTHVKEGKEMRKQVDKKIKSLKKPEKIENVRPDAPTPILPKTFKDLTILTLDPIEVARQMTIMEEALFRGIRPREFIKQAWNKAGKELNAPGITKFTNHINKMINWVTTEILKVPEAQDRANVITKFIKIAKELRELLNFNGVMEILSSLHSGAVSRLKQSWTVRYNVLSSST